MDLCKAGHKPKRVAYTWPTINRIFRVCEVCGHEIWEILDPAREEEISLLFDPYQRNTEGGFRDGTELLLVLVLLVLAGPTAIAWQAALEKWLAFIGG